MITFLLFILIVFVVLPVGYAAYKVWRMQRRMREFMRDPFAASQREAERKRRKGQGSTGNPFEDFFAAWGASAASGSGSRHPRRRKKIPRDVGEYVRFTEVRTTSAASASGSEVRFTREEQIEDAQWEDIK